MRTICKFVEAIALVFLCGNVIAAPSMSDREAKSLIEEKLNSSFIVLPLGSFTVVREGYSIEKGSISHKIRDDLVAWAKVGLVSVTADQRYEKSKKGDGYNWDQWHPMTQEGVSAKITVSPTDNGKRLIDPEKTSQIKFPQGTFKVATVAKNEERKKGVDDYRLIMVAFDAAWSPLLKQFSQIIGKTIAENRKAIVLFKWDPFSSKWKIVATDVANANEEFKSSQAADALR